MERKESNKRPTEETQCISRIEAAKRELAEFLRKQSLRLSPTARKIIAGFIGLVMATLSVSVVIISLRQTGSEGFPKELITPIKTRPAALAPLTQEEIRVLVDFKHAIDSLRLHDPVMCNEILKDHKGLLDTINFLLRLHTPNAQHTTRNPQHTTRNPKLETRNF